MDALPPSSVRFPQAEIVSLEGTGTICIGTDQSCWHKGTSSRAKDVGWDCLAQLCGQHTHQSHDRDQALSTLREPARLWLVGKQTLSMKPGSLAAHRACATAASLQLLYAEALLRAS